VAAAAVLTVAIAIPESAATESRPAVLPPVAAVAPNQSRIVSARVWHTRIATVPNTNARRIGRSLASLRPTWVTGMLRYARNQYPHRDEVRAWRQIRRIVHTASPSAQFDLVLNAMQYRTPRAIRTMMRRMRAKLNPEGWFFDFYSQAFRKHPRMIRAAINSAHGHGEWIGGNVFGIARHRPLPVGSDFFSVQDAGIHLNKRAVRRLARSRPVMYHLHSDPDKRHSGGCRFIRDFSDRRRRMMLRGRARQQLKYDFRVSYPVLFPQCLRRGPEGHRTFLRAFNAFRHPKVAREINRLLDRYDFDPAT
jgi:hypothetical protein